MVRARIYNGCLYNIALLSCINSCECCLSLVHSVACAACWLLYLHAQCSVTCRSVKRLLCMCVSLLHCATRTLRVSLCYDRLHNE
jgi:hypothetical protein